jgi:hypothetical protein
MQQKKLCGYASLLNIEIIGELREAFEKPITINGNNQGMIALSKNNKFHARTKHINMRYHFIHKAVKNGKINVTHQHQYLCSCTYWLI